VLSVPGGIFGAGSGLDDLDAVDQRVIDSWVNWRSTIVGRLTGARPGDVEGLHGAGLVASLARCRNGRAPECR